MCCCLYELFLGVELGRSAYRIPKFLVIGHRGHGMNVLQSSDRRMRAFKENSISSFNAASCFPIDFIEFDVQVRFLRHSIRFLLRFFNCFFVLVFFFFFWLYPVVFLWKKEKKKKIILGFRGHVLLCRCVVRAPRNLRVSLCTTCEMISQQISELLLKK